MRPTPQPESARPDTTKLRVAAALIALALALVGCATSSEPAPAEDSTTVSASRCAPGSVLDARHRLCNGASGRWW